MDASGYYERYWAVGGWAGREGVSPSLARVLAPWVGPASSCLDVGCGDGRTTGRWLAQRAGAYVGVDVSQTALEEARSLGLDARRIDDAAELPFHDAEFDLVVCFEVLEHLFDPPGALREIARVARPGGAVVISVPNVAYWQRRVELLAGTWNPFGDERSVAEPWRDPHVRFFTEGALRRLLEQVGFGTVEVGGHDGSFRSELPGLRRVRGTGRLQPLYERLELRHPGLLGARLHAVARPA